MGTSEQTPLPDGRRTPEIERAMRTIDRLVSLVDPRVIVTTKQTVPNEQHNWDIVAPAMLSSARSCLVSLRWLAEAPTPQREEDVVVLLRRLYEHVVLFAWIAMDPPVNARKWVAEDYRHRLSADTDLARLGVQSRLTQDVRDEFQEFIDKHGTMPDVASRADHADRFWTHRIDGHGTFPRPNESSATGAWSLRKMYAAVYRPASAHAHPTAHSLHDFVWPGGASDTFSIGKNQDEPIDRYPYTMAPLVFATMLLIAEHVVGRPEASSVIEAFEE